MQRLHLCSAPAVPSCGEVEAPGSDDASLCWVAVTRITATQQHPPDHEAVRRGSSVETVPCVEFLVFRERSASDRRVVLVSLTDQGRALEGPVLSIWNTLEEETTAALTVDEQRQLRGLLGRVTDSLTGSTVEVGREPRGRVDGGAATN